MGKFSALASAASYYWISILTFFDGPFVSSGVCDSEVSDMYSVGPKMFGRIRTTPIATSFFPATPPKLTSLEFALICFFIDSIDLSWEKLRLLPESLFAAILGPDLIKFC